MADENERLLQEPAITIKSKDGINSCLLLLIEGLVFGFSTIPVILHIIKINEGTTDYNTTVPNCFDVPNENFSCANGFYELANTICLPDCNKFQQDTELIAILVEVVSQWTSWFTFCTGIIVLVISCVKYKSVFTFPSVFLVYVTLASCIISLFGIITNLNPSLSLFCKHKSLLQSVQDSTNFCKVSGAVFHYFFINSMLWWFFHVSFLFCKLMLPVKAKETEKYHKCIHAAFVVLGLILPLPAVVYTLSNSQYTMITFPPLVCFPINTDVYYYSFILVINVLSGLGVLMFIPMFYNVHKYQGLFSSRNGRSIVLSHIELKLLFVLSYYALFGIVSVLSFQLSLDDQDKLIGSLQEYFACNYCGIGSDGVCQHRYHDYTHSILRAFSLILMSFIPTVILIFMIDWKKSWSFFLRLFCGHRHSDEDQVVSYTELNAHSALSTFTDTISINRQTGRTAVQ